MSYKFETKLRIPLSSGVDCTGKSAWRKVAEIKTGTKVASGGKRKANSSIAVPFTFNVVDIRLYFDDKRGSGLSLTGKDFDWLTDELKSTDRNSSSFDNNYQMLHLSKMESKKNLMVLNTIDDQKVFSAMLNDDDIRKLQTHEKNMKFVLNPNDCNKGVPLYELAKKMFMSQFKEALESTLRSSCSECQTSMQSKHTDHTAMVSEENKLAFVDQVLADTHAWNEFDSLLNSMFNVLNVSESEDSYIKNDRINEWKSNKEALKNEIGRIQSEDVELEIRNLLTFICLYKPTD